MAAQVSTQCRPCRHSVFTKHGQCRHPIDRYSRPKLIDPFSTESLLASRAVLSLAKCPIMTIVPQQVNKNLCQCDLTPVTRVTVFPDKGQCRSTQSIHELFRHFES
ncbi:hypothetical protein FGO68_gene8779 [Halteria grandinella]|uniref:Uncharacterized protein n=1 Tax=Halteria grandinella TaxID=5974 RepID=A0A8J8SUP9_HALGN|nr:hypothetical protein FGO68_gene8779 [Halteria grandinella]